MRKEYIISENFKNNIKMENLLIEISSIFEEGRYTKEINYKVDFQRNFVWDNDKKTYLIESLLLKTEIPPIIIFDTNIENQVIDGRQRCETIERYMNNEFPLKEGGLKVLKSFSGKYYRDLPEKIKIEFSETKLRILKFSFVNKENVNENEEELIKREIFRRYNSGIISLKKEEIERAEYIHDKLTSNLTNKLEKDNEFFNIVKSLFFKRDNDKKIYRDTINALLYKLRRIIILSEAPIKSYAYSNKTDLTLKYCYYYKEKFKSEKLIELYYEYFKILYHIQQKLKERKNKFWNNPLFYECLCWCLNILNNNINIKSENLTNDIINFFYLNRNNKI